MSWGHQCYYFHLPVQPAFRPSVRMQNFESRIGAIYSLPYITDTLYYVNVKLFVDPAFSLDINKRHFVFTKVFSKPHWPHIILLDLGVASIIKVLSVKFQLLNLRLQLILHHLLNKYRDPIKHQPRREKPAENTSVAQLSPSLFYYFILSHIKNRVFTSENDWFWISERGRLFWDTLYLAYFAFYKNLRSFQKLLVWIGWCLDLLKI